MNGSLRYRNGRWNLVIYLGKDTLGKSRQKRISLDVTDPGPAGRKAAEKQRLIILGKYLAGELDFQPTAKDTVADVAKRWLEEKVKPQYPPTTYKNYEWAVRVHIIPRIGHIPVAKLTESHVSTLMAKVKYEGRKDGRKKELGNKAVNRVRTTLKLILDVAVKEWRIIQHNPVTNVKQYRDRAKQPRAFTREERNRFLKVAENDRYYALFFLGFMTGLRRGELLGLTWSNVFLDQGKIRVAKQYRSGELTDELKTAASYDWVPLTTKTVEVLREHRKKQLKEKMVYRKEWQENDLVFCTTRGTPVSPSNLRNRHWIPLLKKAGLDTSLTIHSMRHTFVRLLQEQRLPDYLLQKAARHSKPETTTRIYGRVTDDALVDVIAKLDEGFDEKSMSS